MKKFLLILLGCIGLALGFLGAILPLIPAFPFLLIAAICFGKSSKKLDNWFKSTKLYKENLEGFISGKGMTKKAKVRIMIMITFLMTIGFFALGDIMLGRIILFFVWLFHIFYFLFCIKNATE